MKQMFLIILFTIQLNAQSGELIMLFDSEFSVTLNGSTNYFDLGADSVWDATSSIFFKLALNGTQDCSIIGFGAASTNMVIRYISSSGVVQFRPDNAPTFDITWNIGDVTDNVARTWIIVKDGETTNLYINNGSAETRTLNTTAPDISLSMRTIGKRTAFDDFYVKGTFNSLLVYEKALSSGERTTLHNGGNVSGAVFDLESSGLSLLP